MYSPRLGRKPKKDQGHLVSVCWPEVIFLCLGTLGWKVQGGCPGHEESLPSTSDATRVRSGAPAVCVPESLSKTSEFGQTLPSWLAQVPGITTPGSSNQPMIDGNGYVDVPTLHPLMDKDVRP